MKIIPTALPGVVIVQPKIFHDQRGYFYESFQQQHFREQNISLTFCQDNFSYSEGPVLRGLHYQLQHTQGKLIWVSQGKVFDVAVDIRHGSPTFGQHISVILDDKLHQQLYIPPGFAHGFCNLSNKVCFQYKCTDYYDPNSEKGVLWSDADLSIAWPIATPLLSAKDKNYPKLVDIPPNDLPSYEKFKCIS